MFCKYFTYRLAQGPIFKVVSKAWYMNWIEPIVCCVDKCMMITFDVFKYVKNMFWLVMSYEIMLNDAWTWKQSTLILWHDAQSWTRIKKCA
jgi:hypothetical protein